MSHAKVIAPDGGWGWVVVFAAFSIQFTFGFIRSSIPIIFRALQDEFGVGKGVTSWILSVSTTTLLLESPLAASLSVRFGHKAVTFVGGFITGVAALVSFFADSITFLIITLGFLAGVGRGLCYIPVISMCAMYFDKKRSLAVSLGSCGTGMAMLVLPGLITWLEDEFTWRGMILIMSGWTFNTCVLALLLRPLKTLNLEVECENENGNTEEEFELKAKASLIPQVDLNEFDLVSDEGIEEHEKENIDDECGSPTEVVETTKMLPVNNGTRHDTALETRDKYILVEQSNKGRSNIFNENIPVPTDLESCHSGQEIYKRHHPNQDRDYQHQLSNSEEKSVNNLSIMLMGDGFNSTPNLVLSSMLSLTSKHSRIEKRSTAESDVDLSKDNSNDELNETCFHRLCSVLNVYKNLLTNWKCVLLIIMNCLTKFTFFVPILFMVDRAVENGIEKKSAVFALSSFGGGYTSGQILAGLLADRACTNRLAMYFMSTFLCGLSTCLSVFCGPYLFLHVAYGCVFGLLIGGYISLTPVVLVDILGVDLVAQSYGLCLFFQGFFTLISTPMAGWIFDITGSYTIPFLLNGACLIVSSFLILFLVCHSPKGDKNDKK